MSTSYQDIAVRLSVVEDKIDMIMRSFSITKRYSSRLVPGQVVEEVKSLYELYREIKGAGLTLITPEEAKKEAISPLNGEIIEETTDGSDV